MLHTARQWAPCNVSRLSTIQHTVTRRTPATTTMLDDRTDEQLLNATGAGDASAFGVLFRRHYPRVHGLCARLTASADAEDLAQETFLRVLRFGGDFRGDARFDTWLYRVARNVCVLHLQRAARERSTRERWSIDARVDGDLDALMRDGDDRASVVAAGMARLAPAHREVLVLCRLEGLPFEEVGAILGCTAGAARVRAHRALRALRELCIERARHG